MPLGCRTWNDVFGINGKIVLVTPGVGLWSLLATIIRVSEYQSARNYTKLCLYSLYTAAWTTRSMVCLTAPFNRTRTRPKPYKWLCFSLKSMIITMIFDEKKNIYQTGTTYKSKGDPLNPLKWKYLTTAKIKSDHSLIKQSARATDRGGKVSS